MPRAFADIEQKLVNRVVGFNAALGKARDLAEAGIFPMHTMPQVTQARTGYVFWGLAMSSHVVLEMHCGHCACEGHGVNF